MWFCRKNNDYELRQYKFASCYPKWIQLTNIRKNKTIVKIITAYENYKQVLVYHFNFNIISK